MTATLPPYIQVALVAKACGISNHSARTLLAGAGIVEKIGGRWLVGESRLQDRLPDVYDRVYQCVVLGAGSSTAT